MRTVLHNPENEWLKISFGGQTLTKRQVEIARLVAQGLPNKKIAGRLGVEVGTVKIHLHNIYQKLQISNRARLAVLTRESL
jgi:two-component system, NarL family, nitrate/nitrite response regulator NarL